MLGGIVAKMQRKPGFPVANCSIKVPDNLSMMEPLPEEDGEQHHRRQQLINFGHSQWGFNNWNWAVTKQELDFVDQSNGKYCAGVVAFVSVAVKNIDIHRENIGYATTVAGNKGFAIYKSRKVAVTNALRETMLSFGGAVAADLNDLLETNREVLNEPLTENNQNIANQIIPTNQMIANNQSINQKPANQVPGTIANNHSIANSNPAITPTKPTLEGPPLIKNLRKDPTDAQANIPANAVKNAAPIAKAHPIPANVAPRIPANARPPPPQIQQRPNPNVSFVLPVMGGHIPPMYPPRIPHHQIPPVYPNYYEYGPWHFYEPHGNVNLNFNLPPKNLVVNSRGGSVECKNACREGEIQYQQQNRGCWIKPTIFYDGFWTEQKVKTWVAEQVEKQFPEEKAPSPGKPDAK